MVQSDMLNWVVNNPFSAMLFLSCVLLLCYVIWLRYRMAASKARFALAVVGALASCSIGLLTFMSGPLSVQIANALLSGARHVTGNPAIPTLIDGPNWYFAILGFLATVIISLLIYKFAVKALASWEGPITVSVNDLAKQEQDNNLSLLALTEAKRLIARKSDPIASDVAINWQQRQSEAPPTPPWHHLARNLFETAFAESLFTDRGWRDRSQAWVGEIYVSQSRHADTAALLLLVFDNEPTEAALRDRLETFARDDVSFDNTKIFAVFNHGAGVEARTVQLENVAIEIWSRRSLLRKGLRLTDYARDLIKRFDRDVLGGTQATLRDTFVEAHVVGDGIEKRQPLSAILSEWLNDKSRRHLAITGEYGQGKSTAMLAFCVEWAKRYLDTGAQDERVPLLVELRGQNPAESDPVAFLSPWAGRYGLPPKQVYNLIRAGDAIIIFEGFDELRNAGRAFDRHEHFNALWRMAFPGTKIVFTGRPNFFLDEREKNRTLRSDLLKGAAGNAFTQLWELDRLVEGEVRAVANGFGPELGRAIIEAAEKHPAFFEIVSRPSMLPVVATIWPTIAALQAQGVDLTGAILLEYYLQAIYRRKEEEIERDQRDAAAPEGVSYLLLPREAREIFSLAIVWKMADTDARNTIRRQTFDAVISEIYDDVFTAFQKEGVPARITQRMRAFEERFRDETRADRLERIANEVASAGLFVADPVGGPSNLRLPHKQFYEYLIAKVAWIIVVRRSSMIARILKSVGRNRDAFRNILAEDLSIGFFSELLECEFAAFRSVEAFAFFVWRNTQSKLLELIRGKGGIKYTRQETRLINHGMWQMLGFNLTLVGLAGIAGIVMNRFGSPLLSPLLVILATLWALRAAGLAGRVDALREIVVRRLHAFPSLFEKGGMPIRIVDAECLLVLAGSPKSRIVQSFNTSSRDGVAQSLARSEFRDLVAPVV